MLCIYCSSPLTVKNGHDGKGVQRYKCNDCGRRFCEKGIFARHRYPSWMIMDALFLYSQPISTSGVTKNLKRFRGNTPTRMTIYNWIVKFAPYLIRLASIKPLNFTSQWHVDEKFIKVKHPTKKRGDFSYLWIVSDTNGNILATHISLKRDSKNAEIVLKKAKARAGFNPGILVSDGLQGYKKAVRKAFGKKTRHVKAHFKGVGIVHKGKRMKISNNRAERVNQFPALWLHPVRGFKRLDRANLLMEFFTIYYNYLMPHGTREKVKVSWERVPKLMNR